MAIIEVFKYRTEHFYFFKVLCNTLDVRLIYNQDIKIVVMLLVNNLRISNSYC